jgi:hypothetical protein
MKIVIPTGLAFADLHLSRSASGVAFSWDAIEAICRASGLDVDTFREADEGNVGDLIAAWYAAHLAAGGEPDPVAEDLSGEAELEATRGAVSHAPGRA